jgi:hypothetical protein
MGKSEAGGQMMWSTSIVAEWCVMDEVKDVDQ